MREGRSWVEYVLVSWHAHLHSATAAFVNPFTSFRYPTGMTVLGWIANMERQPCVYILVSQRNGTLYVGVTSKLMKWIWQHKNNIVEGFTQEYSVHTLVWYELHETMESVIQREKNIKNWKRAWKIKAIEAMNPS